MKISPLFFFTTLLASIACANLCAGGAGPSNKPERKPLITSSSSLKEHSALALAQKMFDNKLGAPTLESLETDTTIPDQVKPLIRQKLYQLCDTQIKKDKFGNPIAMQDSDFLNKPEWLRLWFAREYYIKNDHNVYKLIGINDIGSFPITELLQHRQVASPYNNHWPLCGEKIGSFSGFDKFFDKAVLKKLKKLDISYNFLTELPPEIELMSNLEELDLADNQLAALPPEIGQLSKLYFLVLKKNQLNTLPDEIGNLTNLKYLSLNNNRLTRLPVQMKQLVKLSTLNLEGNPELGNQAKTYLGEDVQTFLQSLREQSGKSSTPPAKNK